MGAGGPGINSTGATINHDIGGDGQNGGINQFTARDAYGLTLNYFTGDYKAISGNTVFPGYSSYLSGNYRPLYNGNITSLSIYTRAFEDPNALHPLRSLRNRASGYPVKVKMGFRL